MAKQKIAKSAAPSGGAKPEEKVDIEAVVKKLDTETSSPKPKQLTEDQVMAKDKSKKSKNVEKSSKKEVVAGVTLAEIAKAQKVEGSELRKALRASKINKPGGSWTWPKGHGDIAKVEKLAKSLGK